MGDGVDNQMEKLFLLEVLVDSLNITHDISLNKELEANLADTCVMFQFLHYPPLVVCETDFIGTTLKHKQNSQIPFKTGKSCFFSLRVPKGPILPVPFEVKVNVIRKMKEGILPDKLVVGKTSIDMGESFTELLKQNTDENCDLLPLTRVKKGTFDIIDEEEKKVGNITAFLRMSCFGKLIITQFSLNKEDEKSYLFKGTDMAQICKEEALKGKHILDAGPEGEGPDTPEGRKRKEIEIEEDKGPDTDRRRKRRDEEADDENLFDVLGAKRKGSRRRKQYDWEDEMVERGDPSMLRRRPGQSKTMPIGMEAYGAYGAYGAYSAPPMMSQASYPYPGSPMGGMGGGARLCTCPYPVPPSVMSKFSQRTEKNLDLAPGEVGLQDDQVIFQLPLKKPGDPVTDRDQQLDSQVYYKLTSAEETKDGMQKNTVNVKSDDIPGMATKQVGPVSGLPVDDSHDVFLLKIGKKCDGDKKRNLELELRTPKMKEPKPPTNEKETQYLESDIGPLRPSKTSGKKGSKGGKGGKGGKGKKGKK